MTVKIGTVEYTDDGEVWDAWVGGQSVRAFVATAERGGQSIGEAVAAYVADVPRLFGELFDEATEGSSREAVLGDLFGAMLRHIESSEAAAGPGEER